jgi:hypothetical protein
MEEAQEKKSKLYDDILSIEGFSKNDLRKVKSALLSLQIKDYKIEGQLIHGIRKVGNLDFTITFNLRDVSGVKKIVRSWLEKLNALSHNHSPYGITYEFSNYYQIYLYEVSGKYYIGGFYSFNTTDKHIPMNVNSLTEWVEKNAKTNSLVLTEDILFFPKGMLKTDIKKAAEIYFSNFRTNKYESTACIFKDWNYPYKIFNELPVYSTDEEQVKKEIFVSKCSFEQIAWVKANYPNIYLPTSIFDRQRMSSTYYEEQKIKEGVYCMKTYRDKYKITKDFEEEVKKFLPKKVKQK